MDNFTPLRNGILEHLRDGKLCIFDFAIYVCMIMRSDWSTGIYHGCAGTLAYQCGEPNSKSKINKTLIRLRSREYINYRKGDGTRGGYPILIHKYEVRIGELAGTRLDAWENGERAHPKYKPQNGNGAVRSESPRPKTEPAPVTMPDWMPAESWQAFCEMRQRIRAPLTPYAMRLIITKLTELREGGDDPTAVLNRSVERSWRSVFPLTDERKNGHGTNGAKSKGERIEDSVSSAVREANRIAEQRRGQRETAPH
jgi:hypothetical protein